MKKYSILLMAIFATLFFASCEGPMGPPGLDGEDGLDGADGEVKCLVCHAGTNINNINSQFAQSSHYGGLVSEEHGAWSASCSRCHSHEGFLEYATTGGTIAVDFPKDWTCKTCHGVHETFEATDYALRLSNPVAFIIDANLKPDFGNSNICMNCHQNRSKEPNQATPGSTFNVTIRLGPHHGPQGNIMYGNGFAEIPGTYTYPTAGSNVHLTANARCVGCHMSPYGNAKGGHTWKPGVDGCNSCHAGDDLTSNFNYKNVQTEVQGLLTQLKGLLVTAGVIDANNVPIPNSTCPMILAQAGFNYIGILEDRSLGVHNPGYVEALLNNTIDAVEAYLNTK